MNCYVRRFAWVLAVTCASLFAQEAERLQQVGRTQCIGGSVRQLSVAHDQSHAVTVGQTGDVVWWDLLQQRELARFEPDHRLHRIRLHPHEPWAIACRNLVDARGEAGIFRLDLETGALTRLVRGRAVLLDFDEAGDRIAAMFVDENNQRSLASFRVEDLPAESIDAATWSGTEGVESRFPDSLVFESDGTVRARLRNKWSNNLRSVSTNRQRTAEFSKNPNKLVLDGVEIDGGTWQESWLEHLHVRDDGKLLAIDAQGQVHFFDAAGQPSRTAAPHAGPTHRLAFSPDGRHLAVHGLGATQIIDRQGQRKFCSNGVMLAQAGEAGSEFWFVHRKTAYRWNASARAVVGDVLEWQQPAQLLRGVERPLSSLWAPGAPRSPWLFSPVAVIDGQPWLGNYHRHQIHRWHEDRWQQVKDGGGKAIALQAFGDRNVICHSAWSNDFGSGPEPQVHVEVLDRDGKQLKNWQLDQWPQWFSVLGDIAWVGTMDAIVGLRSKSLDVVAHHKDNPWSAAIPWNDDTLLAVKGNELLLVDPAMLDVRKAWRVPEDMPRIGVIAASPDRSHVAVSNGSDVRILKVPE